MDFIALRYFLSPLPATYDLSSHEYYAIRRWLHEVMTSRDHQNISHWSASRWDQAISALVAIPLAKPHLFYALCECVTYYYIGNINLNPAQRLTFAFFSARSLVFERWATRMLTNKQILQSITHRCAWFWWYMAVERFPMHYHRDSLLQDSMAHLPPEEFRWCCNCLVQPLNVWLKYGSPKRAKTWIIGTKNVDFILDVITASATAAPTRLPHDFGNIEESQRPTYARQFNKWQKEWTASAAVTQHLRVLVTTILQDFLPLNVCRFVVCPYIVRGAHLFLQEEDEYDDNETQSEEAAE